MESLKKSMALHDKADQAALRILELQRDRQKVAMERTQTNIQRLEVKAPLGGMVALENIYRGKLLRGTRKRATNSIVGTWPW
ncbi:MAG: hypothetical protein WDO73_16170 [Ignavibacteriota bacterium]